MKACYHLHVVNIAGVWKTFTYSSWENCQSNAGALVHYLKHHQGVLANAQVNEKEGYITVREVQE